MTSGKLRIESVRQVYHDGNHNAFTDLCCFRGQFYLTFRNCPDGHMVYPTSRILVFRSADGQEWEQVSAFGVPGRDVRDPHFLVFQDTLFVYTGAWLCDLGGSSSRDINQHLGYAAWSADGRDWHGPQFLEGTYGHYIWRAASYEAKAYLCGRRKKEFTPTTDLEEQRVLLQSALMESRDGLSWLPVGLFQEEYGNETAFLFEDDGSVLAIGRGDGGRPAQLCRADPPYRQWTRTDLDRNIGGPLLIKWGDRYLVGGREYKPSGNVTTLYWLVNDQLEQVAELPSGGDNSYPGFVALDDQQGLLSYYSSHEGSGTLQPPASIYLARLSVK